MPIPENLRVLFYLGNIARLAFNYTIIQSFLVKTSI